VRRCFAPPLWFFVISPEKQENRETKAAKQSIAALQMVNG
jgi:hypothetical protein